LRGEPIAFPWQRLNIHRLLGGIIQSLTKLVDGFIQAILEVNESAF
jgi:hypothetical protein